jgi:4-hydroxybenzoate polyprenyltransferase
MRLNKPIGFFLLLWPTLMAVWIASNGKPSIKHVTIFVLGVFLMRSAGCVINDLIDENFDRKVTRTKERPLVTGRVSKREATILFFFLVLLAFLLVIHLNFMTILLSFVAILLASLYPLMKRYTHFPQSVLGMAFSFGIPMAFTAEKVYFPLEAFILYCANFFWIMAYDSQYAMIDKKDDELIGVKSTAIYFGDQITPFIFWFEFISIALFLLLGFILHFNFYYYIGIIFAFILCLYQQYLIKDHEPTNCFKAFLNNHYFGASLFCFLFLEYQFS